MSVCATHTNAAHAHPATQAALCNSRTLSTVANTPYIPSTPKNTHAHTTVCVNTTQQSPQAATHQPSTRTFSTVVNTPVDSTT